MQAVDALLVSAIKDAEQGVDYSPKHGVACPFCGCKTRIHITKPWSGNSRIRYHRCQNERCWMCEMERSIKSIESV